MPPNGPWATQAFPQSRSIAPLRAHQTFRGNMKRSKHRPMIVAVMISAVVGVPLLVHQWKVRSDRAGCLLNMRNMHQTIYSVGGMRGVGAGEPYPGGPRELLKGLGGHAIPPRCPSGGTYSFGSDAAYLINLNKNIRCSHAEDLNHRWPDEPIGEKVRGWQPLMSFFRLPAAPKAWSQSETHSFQMSVFGIQQRSLTSHARQAAMTSQVELELDPLLLPH